MKSRACLIPSLPGLPFRKGRAASSRASRRRWPGFPVSLGGGLLLLATAVFGQTNAALSAMPAVPPVEFSVFRVMGALLLVLALFFGGVWLFKNGQRFLRVPARAAKLNVLEVRSLGHRHALYVVGYEQQRLLLAASPTGVTLLSQLPSGDAAEAETATPPPTVAFADVLRQILGRKSV